MNVKDAYEYGKQSGYSQGKAEATKEQLLQSSKETSFLIDYYTKNIERLQNRIKQYDLYEEKLEQQLQAYKDKELDYTTIYLKGVEDGKDMYRNEIKAKQDVIDKVREYINSNRGQDKYYGNCGLINGEVDVLLQILNEGVNE